MKIVEISGKIMKMHRFRKKIFSFEYIKWSTLVLNHLLRIKQPRKGKEPVLYIRIKDIGEKLHVKNIGDLVYKKNKGKFETNYLMAQNIRKYKKHGSEFIQGIKFMYAIRIIMH